MSILPYSVLRATMFQLDAENAHHWALHALARTAHTPLAALYQQSRIDDPIELAGLRFANRVGLAAGLDKDARAIDGLAALGFGFIEVGTVTPLPQPGNPKPRIFRLPQGQAIINRMGFNNAGVRAFVHNVKKSRFQASGGILGLNIGKNASTPIENAAQDYCQALQGVYPYADYVTINISSPNTANLRSLQSDTAMTQLLGKLHQERLLLQEMHHKRVPLFIKIAPDLSGEQIASIAQILQDQHMDGVIATNTTLARTLVENMPHAQESGGLSGAPLLEASNQVIAKLRHHLGAEFPIIGVGGIMSAADALSKIAAGADVVQLYTGLIYRGPALVKEVAQALAAQAGASTLR